MFSLVIHCKYTKTIPNYCKKYVVLNHENKIEINYLQNKLFSETKIDYLPVVLVFVLAS